MKFAFPSSCLQPFYNSHNLPLCVYPSLVRSGFSCLRFICLLPPLVFLGMSGHAQEGERERERSHVATSEPAVCRWEGLPEVKVQPQGKAKQQPLENGIAEFHKWPLETFHN